MNFATWSNLFYLAPLFAAGDYGLWWVAAATLALFIFSLAFHLSHEQRFVLADIFAAVVAIISGLWLLYFGGFQIFYTMAVGILVLIGLYVRYGLERGDRGGMYHGLWHLVAASAILTCILSNITT